MDEDVPSASDIPINVSVTVTRGAKSSAFAPPAVEGEGVEPVSSAGCSCLCGSKAGGGSGRSGL